jgi:allantoinase
MVPPRMDTAAPYPRDLRGYGRDVPHARWPGGARVAVQFVLNVEEGGENSVLHGDRTSETFLSELGVAQAFPSRHLSIESMYEYGSRAGVWRILREFESRGLPLTAFAVASAVERTPEILAALVEGGHEIACHGLRWIHHQDMPEAEERAQIAEATALLRARLGGEGPLGWYTGRDSPNTRRLVVEQGGYLYDSDNYGDDLPFWTTVVAGDGRALPHLVVPYALDTNDMRVVQAHGYPTGDDFLAYLRDAFDALWREGDPAGLDRPKLMSVGMHARLLGRPGRIGALRRFLDHVQAHADVWVPRRIDVARHWIDHHPYDAATAWRWT